MISNRPATGHGELVDATAVGHGADSGNLKGQAVTRWAAIAISRATVHSCDDPPGLVATVAGIEGPWGFGVTCEAALEELRSVLVDWVGLKVEDGDDDIPGVGGVGIGVAR